MAHRRLGALYARSFERRPWLTLAIANGTLGAIADTLAQTLERWNRKKEERKGLDSINTLQKKVEEARAQVLGEDRRRKDATSPWDFARTGRFFAFGVGMAPILAEWNKFIEYRFPLRAASAASAAGNAAKVSVAALGKRVAMDQILFAPFGLVCFVGAMGIMEGRDGPALRQKFDDMYTSALFANWQLWPLVQTINFRYMPLRYRVPFTGAIGIAWQIFLSILNASRAKASKDEKSAVSAILS